MDVVTKTDEGKTPVAGRPAFLGDQPATPLSGVDKTGDKPATGADRVAAAKAAIAAKAAPVVATPPVATADDKPAEITDEAIVKAGDKAKELAAVKAAVIAPADDFATKAAKAQEAISKGDHLKALEILGIPLDGAVRQATGAPATTTEEETLKAENKRLADENAQIRADVVAREAHVKAQGEYQATVSAIVADKAFPNITTAEHVDKALADAKTAYKALVSEVGRDLNESEKDRLVKHYLKRYNDTAMASEQAPTPAAPSNPSVKSGSVQPARPVAKRTVAQVKADILAKKPSAHPHN